jgi:uncharacterized OB-fold protein
VSILLPQSEGIPVPRPGLHSQPYWEGCRANRLLYQRCTECSACGLGVFSVCARCLSTAPVWNESAGLGSLYSWTVVWRPPNPSFAVPYAPAVVRLDEGFWMMSAIIGCEPEALHDGLRVGVEFHPASPDITLPYFRPT